MKFIMQTYSRKQKQEPKPWPPPDHPHVLPDLDTLLRLDHDSTKANAVDYALTVRVPTPDDDPAGVRRLRAFLKVAWRRWGVRCKAVVPVDEGGRANTPRPAPQPHRTIAATAGGDLRPVGGCGCHLRCSMSATNKHQRAT